MLQEAAIHIPYEEYKTITELMHAHLMTHEGQLRALVAFGALLTDGSTFDIDILEVVEEWRGPAFAEFASSVDLPLRGRLRLYLLRPEDFEHPERVKHFQPKQQVTGLLERVRAGYEVIYEDPPGYARRVLTGTEAPISAGNPLEFLNTGTGVQS